LKKDKQPSTTINLLWTGVLLRFMVIPMDRDWRQFR